MSIQQSQPVEENFPLDAIDPPEHQHRTELDHTELGRLADSLNELGLLQPIGLVREVDSHRARLVWGWRRFNAARLAHWVTIRARIFPPGYDADRARAAENEFRQDLNPIERAQVCARWLSEGLALAEIARRMRREVGTVQGWLDLLQLPDDLRDAVATGALSASVARELARVDFDAYRADLLNEAIRTGATTRVVASWAAYYAADRDRIITNTITVNEIVQRAGQYRTKVICEAGGEEVPIEDSRSIRVCVECYRTLTEAFAVALAAQANQVDGPE